MNRNTWTWLLIRVAVALGLIVVVRGAIGFVALNYVERELQVLEGTLEAIDQGVAQVSQPC